MERLWVTSANIVKCVTKSCRSYSTAKEMTDSQKLKLLRNAYLFEGKYKSTKEMATDLAKNIVYYDKKRDKSGLIVINKPAGVPLKTSKDNIGLEDAMPELSQILGVEKIEVVKSVHKYASGCVVLTSKENRMGQITRAINRGGFNDIGFSRTYYALTNSIPRKDPNQETVDIVKKEFTVHGITHSKPVIERQLMSNKKLRMQRNSYDTKRITVNSEVVTKSANGQSTLLRIEPTSEQNNFVWIYCADLLSPIIGDGLYGYRAKMLMGKMVKVDYQLLPDANSNLQTLPKAMLSKLGLKQYEEHMLPLHLHLGRLRLPDFFGASKDLTIHAPPRPYFLGTAEMLNIDIPTSLLEDTQVRKYGLIRSRVKQKRSSVEILEPNNDNIFEELS